MQSWEAREMCRRDELTERLGGRTGAWQEMGLDLSSGLHCGGLGGPGHRCDLFGRWQCLSRRVMYLFKEDLISSRECLMNWAGRREAGGSKTGPFTPLFSGGTFYSGFVYGEIP